MPPKTRIAVEPLSRLDDPRVKYVLAVYERSLQTRAPDSSLMSITIDGIVGFQWESWATGAMRNVLVAYLVNAPDSDLTAMAKAAKGQLAWLRKFELEVAYERETGESCYGDGFDPWSKKLTKARRDYLSPPLEAILVPA
jgi:hypothetical protein